MAKQGSVDWSTIKTEYITTNTSYRKLAEKYGVSITAVCDVGKRDNWVEMRRQFLNKAYAKAEKKAITREANRLAKARTATDKAIDVVLKAFSDPDQFYRYIVSESVGGGATETEERIFGKVDTKAVRDLTLAIKELTALQRDFYNLPTPAQAEAQRIAAERFELEKRKAEAENDTDNSIQVIIKGEAEDWSK